VATFYLDADVQPTFRVPLERSGHKVLKAHDFDLGGAIDALHLVMASNLEAILVTHNGKDFRTLCQAWPYWRETWGLEPADHAGVIAIPQQTHLPYPQAAFQINRLLISRGRVWNQLWYFDLKAGDWVQQA
jgi:hypothetical protein